MSQRKTKRRVPRTDAASPTPAHEVTQRYGLIAEQVGRVLVASIRWGIIGFTLYHLSQSLERLAGTDTNLKVAVDAAASFIAPEWLGGLFGIGGVGYGYAQNRQKKRKTRDMAARIAKLEAMIDPDRTSSNLMSDGSTRPDDK